MATYAELERSLIQDMAREGEEGVTAAAATAISNAIRHYEAQTWWFLETRTTITSSSSAEYYTVPSDFREMDSITIEVSNNTYPLVERHYSLLEDWSTKATVFTGYPTDYSLYNDEIRLYPVPNGAYPLVLSYRQQLGTPSANGSNAWTTECELMIRSRAQAQLSLSRYQDTEGAAAARAVEQDEYNRLHGFSVSRQMTGKPRKRRI